MRLWKRGRRSSRGFRSRLTQRFAPRWQSSRQNSHLEIDRLQRILRDGSFVFAKQRGVLKSRKVEPGASHKPPRPIVVAPVVNRVVQRAILNVLSKPKQIDQKTSRMHRRSFRNSHECRSASWEGDCTGKIDIIKAAIAARKRDHSSGPDLVGFFQHVPKERVRSFISENFDDARFCALFMDALETELSNEDEVKELISLFPIGEIGVPQGSSLSALCANIVLYDFDRKLNGRGIVTVRYLDDFVILGPSRTSVMIAWKSAGRNIEAR